jgi:hypothetical protein
VTNGEEGIRTLGSRKAPPVFKTEIVVMKSLAETGLSGMGRKKWTERGPKLVDVQAHGAPDFGIGEAGVD